METCNVETYQVAPAANDDNGGTFFFTDCGNRMYSVRNEMAYHGCICPKCKKTLYIRGSKEANQFFDEAFESKEKLTEYLANARRKHR